MKFLSPFASIGSQISYTNMSFESYFNLLSNNFMLVILLFIGVIVGAFLFYNAICTLILFWNQLFGTDTNYLNYNNERLETEI